MPLRQRIQIKYRDEAGVHCFWFFPDGGAVDSAVWTDREFRPVEPPAAVREAGES